MGASRLWRWLPAILAAGLATVDAAAVEPNRLKVGRVDVAAGDHTDSLEGVRLVHLSDLHVGSTGWRPLTAERAVDACNRESADLIAITGDLISGASEVQAALDILSGLSTEVPRLAVFGNHDHVYGRRAALALRDGLREQGIVVLNNDAVEMELSRGPVWFVGIDDGYTMRDDLGRAESQVRSGPYPRILLTHYPDVADRLRPGQYQLSMAGHSHGGQIRLPILTGLFVKVHARTHYTRGLYTVNGNPLHVSPGVGMSALPLRLFNWPEVTVLRFVRGEVPRG